MNNLEMLITGPVNMWASMAGNETNKRRRRTRSEVQRMVRELLLAGLAGTRLLNNKTQGGGGLLGSEKRKIENKGGREISARSGFTNRQSG